MGANLGGFGSQEGQPPPMSPVAAVEAGKLGAGMVGGTTLTPATPSATGGGTGGLPTATLGRPTGSPMAGPSNVPMAGPPNMPMGGPQNVPMGVQKGDPSTGLVADRDGGLMTDPLQKGPIKEGDTIDGTTGKPIRDEIIEPSDPTTGDTPDLTPDLSGTDFSALEGLSGSDIVFGGDPVFGKDTDWSGVLGDAVSPTGGGIIGPTGGTGGGTGGTGGTGPTGQSLLDATTGGDIASQFGFDPSQYGGYFSPVSDKMKTAATEEGYTGFLGEQRAQLRETGGQQRRGLRASLLQDMMAAQQQGGATGFAGSGAQTQALGLAREGRQLGAEQLASQYGKGMYGVRQQIAGRVTAGEQALASAQKSMYDRALALQKSGATMGAGAGAGVGGTPSPAMLTTDTAIDPATEGGSFLGPEANTDFDDSMTQTGEPGYTPRVGFPNPYAKVNTGFDESFNMQTTPINYGSPARGMGKGRG
tara:strand:+ start:50 stop:1471 length:1422 start_codon:yes stop_codon:yes gene_type:complete